MKPKFRRRRRHYPQRCLCGHCKGCALTPHTYFAVYLGRNWDVLETLDIFDSLPEPGEEGNETT